MADYLERITTALADRYTIEGEIGRGGMATVYRARDPRLSRYVALKVLRPEVSSLIGSERFRREIAIAATLNHPHIVAVHDSGEADGFLYFVMPYVEGTTLREALDTDGPFPLERALRVIRDVAEGLDHAHAAGIVHRDIKPNNILLSNGHALIADFGVARAVEQAASGSLTTSGIAIGTPAYMSPEQAMGDREIDARSDVYALGCVFYEMLTGELPFKARNIQALLSMHVAGRAPSLSVARKDVPAGVAGAVQKALSKSPDERYSTATDFVAHVAAAAGSGQPTILTLLSRVRTRVRMYPMRARMFVLLASLTAVAGLALLAAQLLPGPPPWPDGRPSSIVVVPFSLSHFDSDDPEQRLAIDLAAGIISELDTWETITTVPQVALAGPMFDLGLTPPIIERVDEGLELARAFAKQALLAVTVRLVRGDSADVEATVFDSESGKQMGQPHRVRGPASALPRLAGAIAAMLLGLDPAAAVEAPYRHSTNPRALDQEAAGRRQLERWQLLEAEQSFRAAIALDSTFAMAHHRLALTLYWQAAQIELQATAVTEIARESAAALRHASRLSARDSLHIRAFFAFQAGDLETARSTYNALLERDSTDVYALLLLGCVEYHDPWLTRSGPDSWRPRSSLDLAKWAFRETLRLQPNFELGYGHLFDIHALVVDAIDRGVCVPLEEPTGEQVAPWDQPPLENTHIYCAVQLDSLGWMLRSSLASLGDQALVGADRLFRESLGLLRRWADYSPATARPHSELVSAILRERSRLRATDIERVDSLTREALTHAETALALSSDTLPADLVRLANLYLAADSVTRALELTELGLARSSGPDARGLPLPLAAANVFMATGQPTRAMPLVTASEVTRRIRDPATGEWIPYGDAVPVIERLRVLAASGVAGPAVRGELDRLIRLWTAPAYTAAQQRLLRADVALRLAPALLAEPGALLAWNDGLEVTELLWQVLVLSDTAPALASAMLDQAIAEPPPSLSKATNAFLMGVVAARTGDHRLAARLFSRMDSIPLSVDALDMNWGARWVARYHRAASYEALGENNLALEDYETISREWSAADPLAAPLLEDALRRASALRERR